MAGFNLERIRFTWRGDWEASTAYAKDDIVHYKGKAFVCKKAHTSDADFYVDRGVIPQKSVVKIERNLANTADVFFINGDEQIELALLEGQTYEFDISDSSLANQTFLLSQTDDGNHNGGIPYTDGVEVVGTPGTIGAKYIIRVFKEAPTLYYYNSVAPGYGNTATTPELVWERMADGEQWRGDWTAQTFYDLGDYVKHKGYLYKCVTQHTSAPVTSIALSNEIDKWVIVATTYNWTNTWTTNNPYDLGDVVRYNGITYICTEKHRSDADESVGLEDDQSKWAIVTRSDEWRTDWTTNTRYRVDDLVKYGAITYRCIEGHTSAATETLGLEDDDLKWEVALSGIEYKGDYTTGVRYKENDIVKNNHSLWICTDPYTSASTIREEDIYWDLWLPGLGYELLWDADVEYFKGDIVLYGGYTYTALTNNTNSVPSQQGLAQDTGDWELLKQGYKHRGEWNASTDYRTGDVIRNYGRLYICINDNTGVYPDNSIEWQLLVPGVHYRGEWLDNTRYYIGDIVMYESTAYYCIERHLSTESDARPDLDMLNPDQNYWRVYIQGTETNVLVYRGDLRTQDDIETSRLPVGLPGEALKSLPQLGSDSTEGVGPNWENFEEVQHVFYVSPEGKDEENFGKTLSAPFKTIRYACAQVAASVNTEFEINLNTIVTAISEIQAQEADPTYQNLTNFLKTDLNFATTAAGSPGSVHALSRADIDQDGNVSSTDVANMTAYVNNGTTGNSTYDDFILENIINAIYEQPMNFRQDRIYLAVPENSTIFVKTGTYYEDIPISVPQNCAIVGDELRSTNVRPVTGKEQENMFYLRNGSGLRNMTFQGLEGTLGDRDPNYGTLRPSAGAFVSLDPGANTADSSAWITYKSPYVQNCSTFGTGCIGMKIDGELHDGGNKSIVANDFTQILSDGIGYWANKDGKSELVSVFTYYNYIGYLATDGGKLRATNGNNSYGTFGSRAEGVDPDETPITTTIDNQSKHAQAEIVHNNGSQIVAVGYSNAGQSYTNASITVDGSGSGFGVGEVTYDEIRQGAVSKVRILGNADSTIPGGLNYQYLLNSAQFGDSTSIRLSAADDTGTNEKYAGMRIVIVSGLGIGQYAKIASFDTLTKEVIVERESDGTSGWEHLYPGYPIEDTLDGTTRYSIEPLVEVDRHLMEFSDIANKPNLRYSLTATDKDGTVLLFGSNGTNISLAYSIDNGISWTETSFGDAGDEPGDCVWTGSAFVLACSTEGDHTYRSTDGITWTKVSYDVAIGGGDTANENPRAVKGSLASDGAGNVMFVPKTAQSVETDGITYHTFGYTSTDHGQTWTKEDFTGQSECFGVVYGLGKFVVLYTTGILDFRGYRTWTPTGGWVAGSAVTIGSGSRANLTTTQIVYGSGHFVGIEGTQNNSRTWTSIDGETWYQNDSDYYLPFNLTTISYGDGVFIATDSQTSSNNVAKSRDGVVWRYFEQDSTQYAMSQSTFWKDHTYLGSGVWFATGNDNVSTAYACKITTGADALLRVLVASSRLEQFLVYDPGAFYSGPPTVTVIDSQATALGDWEVEWKNGVLPQPAFANRGEGYVRSSATISGDGFADIYQTGNKIIVKDLSRLPGPGDNLEINGIDDVIYRVVKVIDPVGTAPNITATLQISPTIDVLESPEHEEDVIIRQQYSQVRLTGHDFLDIGTGSFSTTDYPNLYLFGYENEYPPLPFNEVSQIGGGRVFYTSTDQDGNFRVGELFEVEQNTGIVSVNADFFELGGLTEISLGGIVVGGTAVVIREFSKDPYFTANSNNIVPTEAAIISYLESRISGGGSDATTNTLIAGQVKVSSNYFDTTSGFPIVAKKKVNLIGGADGQYLASMYTG